MGVIKINKALIINIGPVWGFSTASNLMVMSVLMNNVPGFLDHIKFTYSGVHISKLNDVHEKIFLLHIQAQILSIGRYQETIDTTWVKMNMTCVQVLGNDYR